MVRHLDTTLVLRDHAVVALPLVGDERFAFQPDLVEQLAAGHTITPTQATVRR